MIEKTKDINDYLSILRRRRNNLILPLFFIFPLSILLAFTLPTIYRSSATILIEQQEIPEELVLSTVTGYAEVRLHEIDAF